MSGVHSKNPAPDLYPFLVALPAIQAVHWLQLEERGSEPGNRFGRVSHPVASNLYPLEVLQGTQELPRRTRWGRRRRRSSAEDLFCWSDAAPVPP